MFSCWMHFTEEKKIRKIHNKPQITKSPFSSENNSMCRKAKNPPKITISAACCVHWNIKRILKRNCLTGNNISGHYSLLRCTAPQTRACDCSHLRNRCISGCLPFVAHRPWGSLCRVIERLGPDLNLWGSLPIFSTQASRQWSRHAYKWPDRRLDVGPKTSIQTMVTGVYDVQFW